MVLNLIRSESAKGCIPNNLLSQNSSQAGDCLFLRRFGIREPEKLFQPITRLLSEIPAKSEHEGHTGRETKKAGSYESAL